MMNKVLHQYSEADSFNNQTAMNATGVSSEVQAVSVAVTVTFLVGAIQVGRIDLCLNVFQYARMKATLSCSYSLESVEWER